MRRGRGRVSAWLMGGIVCCVTMHVAPIELNAQTAGPPYQSLLAIKSSPSTNFYRGSASCSGCHSGQGNFQSDVFDRICLNEYQVWSKSDLHASAYASLTNDRGNSIGRRLNKDVHDAATGCIQCHGVATELPANLYDDQTRQGLLKNGIDCEACHGPSANWIGPHSQYRPRKYPQFHDDQVEKKTTMGWIDVRSAVTRAELCVSCHQGSSEHGRVITHDMYAAGHPPLTGFELETFADKMPRHWRYAREKSNGEPSFERTRNLLVAAIVSMRMSVELTVTDAAAPTQSGRWPELARLDCFACHHELQAPGVRPVQSGFPGRPPIVVGCMPLIRVAAGVANKSAAGELDTLVNQLTSPFEDSPFGDPGAIAQRGKAIIAWCRPLEDRLASMKFTGQQARSVLRQISEQAAVDDRDYDTARQLIGAWVVCYRELVADNRSGMPANAQIENSFQAVDQKWRRFIEPIPFVRKCGDDPPVKRDFDETLQYQFTNRIDFDPARFRVFMSKLASKVPE